MTKEELVCKAIEARDLSYSPYSKFAVGAAIGSVSAVVKLNFTPSPLTLPERSLTVLPGNSKL